MAVLGQQLGYLAILAPRTGCTAMSVHLITEGTGEWLPPEDLTTPDGTVVPRKHTLLRDVLGAGLITAEERDRLTVFTTVRNPFDSLVTLWAKYVGSYVPLLDDPDAFIHRRPKMLRDIEFCRDHSFSDWVRFRFGATLDRPPRHLYGGFLDGADRVLQFEQLQDDLDRLLADLGQDPPLPPIPVLNETDNRPDGYRDLYDEDARRIVGQIFAPDLERFGYAF